MRQWTTAPRPVDALLAVQIVRQIHAIQRDERGGWKSTSQSKEERERCEARKAAGAKRRVAADTSSHPAGDSPFHWRRQQISIVANRQYSAT